MSTTPVTVTAYGSYIDLQKHASGTPPETSGSIYLSGAAASEMVYISTTASLPVLLITGSTGLANGSVKVSAILDEDDMTSNAAGALATQQSIKAYVDAQLTAQDLDFQGDSGGALAIDLDSETLTIAGGDGLASAGSGNTLTMNVDITNQAAATGVNNSDTILIDDGDGGTIRKMTRAHFLGSAAADFTNGATATTVSGSGQLSGMKLIIDTDGFIGTAGDTNLLQLENDELKINGSAHAVAGELSASTTVSGRSFVVDNGKTIGCAADTNLMTLTANTLTVAGATVSTTISGSGQISGMKLILDEDGVIGTSADADLLTLEANELKVAGAVHATAGEVSASTTVSGRSVVVDTGFTVGCAADTDLLTLGNAALTAKGTVTVGASTAGHDVTFYGTNANDLMLWDASENAIIIKDGNSETVRMGGDATSAYAVDVQDGSNAINKIRAAAFVTYSDERLKSDVKPMRNALKTVNSLKAVNFTWKKDGVQDFGFLAQDLKKAVPQAVHGTEDGLYGVDYGRLTSILVSAIQEQSIQIEMLKAKLDK